MDLIFRRGILLKRGMLTRFIVLRPLRSPSSGSGLTTSSWGGSGGGEGGGGVGPLYGGNGLHIESAPPGCMV
jgi:hypothetical protein